VFWRKRRDKTNAEFAEGAEGAEKKRMKSGNFVTLDRKSRPLQTKVDWIRAKLRSVAEYAPGGGTEANRLGRSLR